jgi:CheY-like chemotaxis protein
MKNHTAKSSEHDSALDTSTKLTMLVVDDSKVIRLALNKILRTDYNVIQANDGEEAWTILSENEHISAVFSDVSMPILDGFGLLDRVRSSDESRIANIPFVIITANEDDEAFVNKVNQAGGTDLVTKPFKTNEIMQCLSTHVLTQDGSAAPMAEYQENKVPQEDLMNTQEVATLMGFDEEPAKDDSQHLDKIDESMFSELATAEQEPESIKEELDTTDVILENSGSYKMSEDVYEPSEVEFTIDEDFFNGLDEIEEVADSIPDTVNFAEPPVTPSRPVDNIIMENEFTLEPIPEPVVGEPVAADITDAAIDVSPDVFTSVEQDNRSTFNEVDISSDSIFSEADKARQATETNQIRAELMKLREQEINKGTYSQDLDFSASGKISSFFIRLKRIISRVVGINRKN